MPTESGATSPIPTQQQQQQQSIANCSDRKCDTGPSNGTKGSSASYDPTPYIQRARVTRPAPPKPSCNPMQFVQIKPCHLYQSAQEQLKRAEEVKKVKEVKKEDPEDWQSNLDNWKSSRRKRVEHIIDRVVEVKKLEMEEHDRTRRKSKTFSEMLEERGSRRKLSTLAVYTEDEANDFSDLGIGTSSASGKSSLSEDYDNHSVMSDNADTKDHAYDVDNNLNHETNGGDTRDYISSPGYDTSSSTAPTSSPDPCEYTYEGAIQDYKTRVSRAQSATSNGFRNSLTGSYSKDSTPERTESNGGYYAPRRMSNSRIEDRLMNFKSSNEQNNESNGTNPKKDLPKVDILKRRELFEKENSSSTETMVNGQKRYSGDFSNSKSIKERLSSLEKKPSDEANDSVNKKTNRLSADITSIRDRLQNLEKQNSTSEKSPKIDVPVVPLKDRLSSLQSAVKKEEVKKPVVLVDEHQLEILKKEEESKRSTLKQHLQEQNDNTDDENLNSSQELLNINDESNIDTDREDSGIHTTDVSCSVSQTDEQPELVNEESHHHINEDELCHHIQEPEVEEQLIQNIETVNEQHQSELNQEQTNTVTESSVVYPDVIPVESTTNSDESKPQVQNELQIDVQKEEELKIDETNCSPPLTPTSSIPIMAQSPEPPLELIDLEASVDEALELALQEIDKETTSTTVTTKKESSSTKLPANSEQSNNKNETEVSSQEVDKSHVDEEHIYENVDKKPQQLQQVESNESVNPINEVIDESETNEVISSIKTINNNHIIMNCNMENIKINDKVQPVEDEPYYQVPKSSEPYYDVPKNSKPIPVYENIDIFYPISGNQEFPIQTVSVLEPPKEKPPPPPIDIDNEGEGNDHSYEVLIKNSNNKPRDIDLNNTKPMKRMNSTKRIKKELRNKRSSFLGIEGTLDDDSYLELTVAPPPDLEQLLQEERRLEKQLYIKAGLYDSSDTGDSRDSGVSENHSRQSSEPFTTSSEEHDDLLVKKEKEIIEVLEKEEEKRRNEEKWSTNEDDKIRSIEDQIREQEEVLRVERELLQLEQEELQRQRETLLLRENLARRELQHGAKMLMSANHCQSLQDINASSGHYANLPNQIYRIETDYRKSMSDLQEFGQKKLQTPPPPPPPVPPAKPLRSHLSVDNNALTHNNGLVKIASNSHISSQQPVQHSQSVDEFVPLRNYQPHSALHHGNMTRHTLLALSATPKPKYTDAWIQTKKSPEKSSHQDSWLSYQQKRKSVPEGFNYNKHWLIQEAEQRRIDQERGVRSSRDTIKGQQWITPTVSTHNSSAIQRNGSSDNKPLPDSVIQTLTQRVQSKGIGERKRLNEPLNDAKLLSTSSSTTSLNTIQPKPTLPEGQQDKILSVSGKKKCSHCGEELGRGAAMIIESLRLFYHIDCFKCCVCHVQLGDGLNGTDVRVRHQKLHCHNCYSSDDGIKFSCV